MLYTQLLYYSKIFDIGKVMTVGSDNDQGNIDKEVPDRKRELFAQLKSMVDEYLNKSEWNVIDLDKLFILEVGTKYSNLNL